MDREEAMQWVNFLFGAVIGAAVMASYLTANL